MATTTIYDEDVEWAFSTSNPGSIVANDNSNPHTGLLDIAVTNAGNKSSFTLTSPSSIPASTVVSLSLWIDPTNWNVARNLTLQWFDITGVTAVGSVVTIQNGAFGFNNALNAYQNIVIPASAFAFPAGASVGVLTAIVNGGLLSFFADTIILTTMPVSCNPSDVANSAICFSQCIPDSMAVRSLLLSQFVPCIPGTGIGGGNTGGTPIVGCNAPLAPTNLSSSNIASSQFTVSWQQPLNIPPVPTTQFVVQWSLRQVFSALTIVGQATVPGTQFSFTITGLSPSTTYFVRVLAFHGLCPSPASNTLTVATAGTSVLLPQLGLLALELESLDFDGTANGSSINLWNDKSGSGHNFNLTGVLLNGNPGIPTVDGATTLNGHKTVRFNNNAIIGIAAFSWAAAPGLEMIMVYKTDLPVVGNGVFQGLMRIDQATNTDTPFTDNNFYESFGRTTRPNIGQPVTSLANFVTYDISSKSDNSAYNAWINTENFFSSGAYTFDNIQHANQTTLGGGYTGVTNLFASGNIAAVYVWNTFLSAADRLQARAYIKQTWGNGFGF